MTEQPGANEAEFRLPPDVRCAHHTETSAEALCGRCGDLICELCTVVFEGETYCTTCRAYLQGPSALTAHIPWERRKQLGFFRSIVETCRMVIRDPRSFYRAMEPQGEMTDALLFVVILRGTGTALAQMFIGVAYLIFAAAMGMPEFAIQGGTQLVASPFAYLGAVINAFLMTLLVHFPALLLGARYGFFTTFRMHAYTSAIDIFQAIPIVGPFIVWPWSIYLHVVAFQEVQEMSVGRALVAALAPTLIGIFAAAILIGFMVVVFAMVGF